MVPVSIVVIGAGLAGARCAETLRSEGYEGCLTLVGEELLGPYERPALSKDFLAGTKTEDELLLRTPTFWANQQIDLRLGERIAHIDQRRQITVTETGDELRWDTPVLATGARPRRLPLLGVRVTMVEALATPLERTLGRTLGRLLADRYRAHGVDVRLRTGAVRFGACPDGTVRSVLLTDGSELRCDVALVGIGVEPANELMPARVDGLPIHACGDVTGGPGHWSSAASDGTSVARRILGLAPLPAQAAFFWSDQFGLRLQLVGHTVSTADVELEGCEGDFIARYRDGEGRLVAALGANRPAEVARLRRELAVAA